MGAGLAAKKNEAEYEKKAGGEPMKIQPDQIPESDITVIARSLIEGIQEYYRNPDNMAAFEQWEKEETSQCN